MGKRTRPSKTAEALESSSGTMTVGCSAAAAPAQIPLTATLKTKASPKNSRKATALKRKFTAVEENPDENMEVDEQNLDKSISSRKQKELPKPSIIINMHHPFPFKSAEYLKKKHEPGEYDEKVHYRPLKHIIGQERTEWNDIPSHPAYWTIKAPPRLKPAKKYSDISGFEAFYTDPETKLHYCDAEEFEVCRSLTRDLVQSYLRLRGYVDIIG